MIRSVCTTLQEYRVAIAELPASTRLSEEVAGAIAVVAGPTWGEDARRAQDAGALAIVVNEPEASAPSFSPRVPVVVSRHRMPSLPALSSPPALITVEVAADQGVLRGVLRDAVGIARVLASSSLRVERVHAPGSGVIEALLSTPGGVPVSLSAGPGTGWLRVGAYGAEEVEIVVDDAASFSQSILRTADKSLTSPQSLENPARSALRAAIAALAEGDAVSEGIRAAGEDIACAEALLGHLASHKHN